MEHDAIDLFIQQWGRERPELDASALGVVSRVLMLGKYLEQSADRALSQFNLSLWQFDVLAALRRSGPPFTLSPSQMMRLVTLTSGAMTNRIDRLEEAGLVERKDDPDDRRGVLIALTKEGRRIADEVISKRLEDARRNIAALTDTEVKALAKLLRKVLISNAEPSGQNSESKRNGAAMNSRTSGVR